MKPAYRHILIVSDIEGSSGCWNRNAASFKTMEWRSACVEMSRDVNAVVRSLADAGVDEIRVKDFHRTGYNLLPELIDSRAKIIPGYHSGPVVGIGSPGRSEAVMFLGMHAASGTKGFLAHTLTSRISRLRVNGKLFPEVALFSASLAPHGIRPIFFSGCPAACQQAIDFIPGIHHYAIDKSNGPDAFDAEQWRSGLSRAARKSLTNNLARPHDPEGPFEALVTMKKGPAAARKLSRRWGFERKGADIIIHTRTMHELYNHLIDLCYLTPFLKKILPMALPAHNLKGRLGLAWVRKKNRDAARTSPYPSV